MTNTLRNPKCENPMWYFERNFSALIEMVSLSRVQEQGRVDLVLAGTRIELILLEQSRYTLLLSIQQSFLPDDQQHLLGNLQFKVRIYLDARLAEVISYQGQQPRQPRYPFPNKRMFYPDEKRQTNLVLYDWLSHCTRLNFLEAASIHCPE